MDGCSVGIGGMLRSAYAFVFVNARIVFRHARLRLWKFAAYSISRQDRHTERLVGSSAPEFHPQNPKFHLGTRSKPWISSTGHRDRQNGSWEWLSLQSQNVPCSTVIAHVRDEMTEAASLSLCSSRQYNPIPSHSLVFLFGSPRLMLATLICPF